MYNMLLSRLNDIRLVNLKPFRLLRRGIKIKDTYINECIKIIDYEEYNEIPCYTLATQTIESGTETKYYMVAISEPDKVFEPTFNVTADKVDIKNLIINTRLKDIELFKYVVIVKGGFIPILIKNTLYMAISEDNLKKYYISKGTPITKHSNGCYDIVNELIGNDLILEPDNPFTKLRRRLYVKGSFDEFVKALYVLRYVCKFSLNDLKYLYGIEQSVINEALVSFVYMMTLNEPMEIEMNITRGILKTPQSKNSKTLLRHYIEISDHKTDEILYDFRSNEFYLKKDVKFKLTRNEYNA